jgi:hypothetical protein
MKNKPTKLLGCSMLVLLGMVVALAAYDPWPGRDAIVAAQAYAKGEGFDVGEGGFAQFVTEPNAYGGCEVEVSLGSVVMRLRRSWRLGEWRVIDIKKVDTSN